MSDASTPESTGALATVPRTGAATLAVWSAATAGLLLPAVWNGFPFVFHDSGGYVAAFVDGELAFGRSAAYGALMAAGLPLAFWPTIVVQAGVTAWMVLMTLRVHGINGVAVTASVLAVLIIATSLPWYTSQLMPDLWAALAALAIYLLGFRTPPGIAARIALVAVVAFAIAGHMATLALVGCLLAALVAAYFAPGRFGVERPALSLPVIAVFAGVVTALVSNFIIAGQFAFTPGGSNFLFARLVHTGIAADYLADHCPDPALQLCRYRGDLPKLGEEWLWEPDSPLNRDLGGWIAFAPEAQRIVIDSLRDDPLAHIGAAGAGATQQFVTFGTGDGLVSWTWNTHHEMERLAPQFVPAFKAARQQQDGFDLAAVNIVHIPVAVVALLCLPVVLGAARRRATVGRATSGRIPAEAATFAGFVLVVLLGNALICGALSIANARYQSRVIWLAPLAVAVAWSGARRSPAMIPAPAG